jgi:hypothetical protein
LLLSRSARRCVNLKYNIDNAFLLRAGISWLKVAGDDKNNNQVDLKARNLSFKSDIIEASLCVEYNLLNLRSSFLILIFLVALACITLIPTRMMTVTTKHSCTR